MFLMIKFKFFINTYYLIFKVNIKFFFIISLFSKHKLNSTIQNDFSQFVKARIYFTYLPDGHESI